MDLQKDKYKGVKKHMKNQITIFALSASQQLAEDIAGILGTEVGKSKVHHFADGEINVQINETVRGHNIFVVQPTSAPVNDHLMELLIMCDALKRASARTINLVIPYYGYFSIFGLIVFYLVLIYNMEYLGYFF